MSKRISRIICMILTLAMVAAFALVPMASAASTKTIYFDNSGKNWSQVAAYTWDANGAATNGSWPGTKMTKVEGTVYSIEVPANAVNIIFNNNGAGAQTSNLTIPTDAKNLFNGSAWGIYGQEIAVTYILAGSEGLCGTAWDPSNTANQLTDADGDKVYTIVYPQVAPGTYEFKVTDGSWENSWGEYATTNNYVLTVDTMSSVEIRFNSVEKHIVVLVNKFSGECSHNYVNSVCTLCGALSPDYVREFYLYGFINNADYGCEADADNMGEYKFVNGKLTVKFDSASYVGVKTTGNVEWYMTSAYTTATSATLYTAADGGCDRMYIPGNTQVTLTLVENANGTLTLSYTAAACNHLYSSYVSTQPGCETQGVRTYTCGYCGHSYEEAIAAKGHTYVNSFCYYCGAAEPGYVNNDYYLFGYINGADYGWNADITNIGEYKFVNGKLTVVFNQDSYVGVKTGDNSKFYLTNGYVGEVSSANLIKFTDPNAVSGDRLYIPGGKTVNLTLVENANGSLTLSYSLSSVDCEHTYHEQDGTCSHCGAAVEHSYNSYGSCSICGAVSPNYTPFRYYLYGYINGADYGSSASLTDYLFVDGVLTVTFTQDSYVAIKEIYPNGKFGPEVNGLYMTQSYCTDTTGVFYNTNTGASEKMFVPGNIAITFTLTPGDGALTLSYTTGGCKHTYSEKVTIAATCLNSGMKTLTCTNCGYNYTETIPATGHTYANGKCTGCGIADPSVAGVSYSLVGYINGANYGCEEDHANPGQYVFVNGKLTATFTSDSYVFVKTTDSSKWFLASSYTESSTCKFFEGGSEKMFVPGGKALTFTLTENADGSITVSYTTASASTVPTLTLKAPTLEFKDMITVNAMFTAENIQDVVEMGMITYSSKVSSWSIATAEHVIPGTTYDASTGRYIATSQGIHAKYLGDTVYLATYAKLADGTYAYSKLAGYSPVQYATSKLNGTDAKLKQLVVAMLNYGAAAQTHFGHNTSALANASLTAAQKALPAAYSSSMVSTVASVPTAKQGSFAGNTGFAKRYPSISFEGAFCINYFFTPSKAPANGITLYYWNAADYNAASVLTTGNATGSIKMSGSGTGEYQGDITGIAAKALSEAVYVTAVYQSGGTTYTSGVLGYSIGAYCSSQATKGGTIAELAKATAVYGYHAKAYFA